MTNDDYCACRIWQIIRSARRDTRVNRERQDNRQRQDSQSRSAWAQTAHALPGSAGAPPRLAPAKKVPGGKLLYKEGRVLLLLLHRAL